MANLVISSDYNLSNPTDFFGNHPVRSDLSPTGFHVYDAQSGNNVYLTGHNLQYNSSGQPVSGTIEGIVCLTGNGQETLFNLSGANIDIQYANSQDWTPSQELSYWLGPNPTVTTVPGGINGHQTIQAPTGFQDVYGYTGNNVVVYSAPSSQFTIEVDHLLSASNGAMTVYQGDPLDPISVNNLHAIQSIQFSDQTIQTSWLTGASALHQTDPGSFSLLSEIYLAYFNRAPDAVGLDAWASAAYFQHASQPGLSMNEIIKGIANTFAESPEAIKTFGTVNAQSSEAELQNFVNKVYTNVLNREPDADGLHFWVHELQTGVSTPGGFIADIINRVNIQSGTVDKEYLSSKAAVGEYFGLEMGLTSGDQSIAVMQLFNHTYDTLGANAAVNAAVAQVNDYSNHLDVNPELIIHLVGVN